MSTNRPAPEDRSIETVGSSSLMERLMAIDAVERQTLRKDPKLRQEIGFQFIALVFCPPFLGYAIYKVAVSLFGMGMVSAFLLAGSVAFGLFTIDRYYLIQARGNASPTARRAILKVRAVSVAMIASSFILTAADTFHDSIGQVLDAAKATRRAELEQSVRYKLAWDQARDALTAAGEAAKRAEEVHARIARIKIDQAAAWEEHRNQCDGNTSGNVTRRSGCGPKARGAEAAANRLGLEIAAQEQDLARLGDIEERTLAARRQFEQIDARLDQEAARAVGGAPQKLDALILMLENGWSARFTVAFWFVIGLVPDLLLFVAQSKAFNHDLFVQTRQVQNEAVMASLAQIRRDLRQEQANGLAPLEIRLAAVPPLSATVSAPANEPELSVRTASAAPAAGERS
jgi:hypothetical protein